MQCMVLFTLFVASEQRSGAESLTVTTFVSNFKCFLLQSIITRFLPEGRDVDPVPPYIHSCDCLVKTDPSQILTGHYLTCT